MENALLIPPIAFSILLLAVAVTSLLSSTQAIKAGSDNEGKRKSYACGEDVPSHRMQQEYGQFFPFAYFFTIMHVVALMVTTVPSGAVKASGIAIVYIIAAACGLSILLRSK